MTFTSLGFLLFFPAVCLLYYLLPAPARPAWLLAASYWFYACADWRGPLLLLAATAVSYGCGRALGALASPRARRAVLVAAAVGFVGVLALFKYADFALESLAALLHLAGIGWQPPAFSLLLPLGISFTTFQILGYLTDVYRGALAPERSFVRYALFLSFFPQIVSGPIARGGALLPQLARPVVFLPDRVRDGLVRMLWGYFEKLVVADQAALVVNTVFADYAAYGGVERLLAAVLYSVQIYTDFAGYSHIALGAAQVLGFTLGENFRQPYLAQSVREFWGRWHISLSGWLRDYLYIPLGGSRAGTLRRYANLLVTFLVSGLWHGAAWHYVVWGGLHAAYQIASLLTAPLRRRCNLGRGVLARWARRGVTFGLVTAAWVFFRADSAGQALSYLGGIAGWFDPWVLTDGTLLTLGLDGWGWFVLFCAVGLVLAVDCLRERGVRLRAVLARQPLAYRWLCYYALLAAVLVFGIWGPGYSAAAFVYFQFSGGRKMDHKPACRGFLLRAVCFLLGACLLFTGLSALLNDKMSRKYAGDFYESGDPYEVLFFGSSHMFNGVLPLQLYRDTGVLSYNLGMTNEYPAVTYWRMVDALQRCRPKVVVVDVYRALSGEKMPRTESDLGLLHNSLDSMPLSLTKVRALADILDAGPGDFDGVFNYLFPLAQFHSRYRSLTEDDYHPYLMETRGAMPLRVWQPGTPLPLDRVPATDTAPLDSAPGETYLRRMMELCEAQGVPIVLMALPFQAPEDQLARLNGIAALAAEYPNAVYLNLLYEDVVDPLIDFSDPDGHLNTAGAARVTAWLGDWLTDRYLLTDRRGSAGSWDRSLDNVRRQHCATLAGAGDLTTALMLLAGQDLSFTLCAGPEAAAKPANAALLARLGVPVTEGGVHWRSPGAPDVWPQSGAGLVAFDPDTGEELARVELG